MASHHLLIAGTGRAGTTALVQLLGACGLETRGSEKRYFDTARAGLEHLLTAEDPPYVVKSPYLSEDLDLIIAGGFDPARIDAIILPLRDLDDAVASRIEIFLEHGNPFPAGLWRRERPSRQRELLAAAVHQLLSTAASHAIPVVLLSFPRFVNDPEYTCACLRPLVPDVDETDFLKICDEVLRPDFVTEQRHFRRWQLGFLDAWWGVYELRRIFGALRTRLGLTTSRSTTGTGEASGAHR